MFRRQFLCLLPAMGLSACFRSSGPARLGEGAILILTRHADRDGEELSEKGRSRSVELIRAVEDLDIHAIYAPGIKRNLDSAAPLAEMRDLDVTRIPQENPTARLALAARSGPVIWIGNKGNLTTIWQDLGLPGDPPLGYGELTILRGLGGSQIEITRRLYGPQDAPPVAGETPALPG